MVMASNTEMIEVLGGRIGSSAPNAPGAPPQVLNVTVVGEVFGQVATAEAPLTLRRLGDIDGDGVITASDNLEMNKTLNGLATLTGIGLRELDLTGDGAAVDAEDKLVINQVLNGNPVP